MCGIVGYIGGKKAQPLLLGALKKLEYRGYDSAGIATMSAHGDVTLLREKGKVAALGARIAEVPQVNTSGIGHTRWATHGEPSVKNAHPHRVGRVLVVHNGIIENYQDIKQRLAPQGVTFQSDTDTEVLAALINTYYNDSLLDAVTQALQEVVGAYGIAVIADDAPDEIVVAKKGSPLSLGFGESEMFIASDQTALVGQADQVMHLSDGEVAVCRRDGVVHLADLEGQPKAPEVHALEMDEQQIQKHGYDHFLLKEIMEQPETVTATLRGRLRVQDGRVHLGGLNLDDETLRMAKNILIIGCGTAHYAGLMAKYTLEKIVPETRIDVVVASEFRYQNAYIQADTVAVVVSQSGETADTLACLRDVQRRGIPTLGVINAVGSTIAREVDGGIYLHVGPEISVASTKAFTSQVVALLLFGLKLAELKGGSVEQMSEIISELDALPAQIKKALKLHNETQKIAKELAPKDHAFYLGRGWLYPVACEGGLKLKETSYIHAESYPAGELKHGPLACIDERFFTVFLIGDDWLYEKSVSNLAEIRARGGFTLVVTDSRKKIDTDVRLNIPTTQGKWLMPLLMNVALQLLAYDVAVLRGYDVDQPRNLAKSVTVE